MSKKDDKTAARPLIQGEDYYLDELGRFVFTETYHLKRGSCCKSGCRHCPYGFNDKNPAPKKVSPS
ncbi:MAG: hypothetical protein EOP09_05435 [Proteobacteria bacterium]|nr:MAG: hypothetical protein EOP09_05435 [Pseudomonadota bacterium]